MERRTLATETITLARRLGDELAERACVPAFCFGPVKPILFARLTDNALRVDTGTSASAILFCVEPISKLLTAIDRL